jgi:beta-lactamase class A
MGSLGLQKFGRLGQSIAGWIRRVLAMREVRRGLRMAAIVLLVVFALQLLYPRGRAMPISSMGGQRTNFLSESATQSKVAAAAGQPFIVIAGNEKLTASFETLGIAVDADAAAQQAADYPFVMRLIPFSLLWPRRIPELPLTHDSQQLAKFAAKIADAANRQPQDAALRREGESYRVSQSRTGVVFPAEQTVSVLKHLRRVPVSPLELSGDVKEPVFSTNDFEQVIAKREKLIKRPLRLNVGDYDQPVESADIAAWVDVAANPRAGKVELTYNQPLMTDYLKNISNQVGTPPTPTTIRLRDGREIGRTKGRSGRAVPPQPAIDKIIAALEEGAEQATLPLETVPAPLVYDRSYTRSARGLQMLVEEWQRGYSGASVGVSIQSLDGTGLAANLNAGKSFFAASMYKLYLAQYLLHGFEDGTMVPGATVGDTGKTAAQCVEAMIVQSDNACPEALVAQISSSTLNNYVRAQGFSGTVFLSDGTNGTAADTASFLRRLQAGQLLNSSNTELLLGYMRRQIYRGAVPAGSAPAAVADKVGFYGSVWHDGGIIYHARGTYVLVAYTENASAAAIKDLARRVNDFMNS